VEGKVKIQADTPQISVSIEGVKVVGICDTGAEVSVISTFIYETYLKKHGIKLQRSNAKIRSVGGSLIPCRGKVIVSLEMCGIEVENVALLVCDEVGENYSCLWGMNILSEVAEIWPVMYKLSRSGVGEEEVRDYIGDTKRLGQLNLEDNRGFVLTAKSQIPIIPGQTVRLVPVNIPQLKQVKSQEVLVEPLVGSHEGWVPEGIVALPTVVRIEHGKGFALIANLSDNVVKLRRNWRIGKISKIDEEVKEVRKVEIGATDKKADVIINQDCLNGKQKERLDKLLWEFSDIFAEENGPIGTATGVQHVIPLMTDQPIRVPYRRIPPHQVSEVKDHINELCKQGVITPSVSPYSAAIVVVRKKDGSLRLCVDYRQLNKYTIRDAFPLPRIDETVEALEGARFFSTFDLAAGYHHIEVHPKDQPKTAFSTPFGHYEFKRLPMGLSNSPSTFQRYMERILGDKIFHTLLVYLDDVIVFSRTVEEHLNRLEELFRRMRKYGLKFKPNKCKLFANRVVYLGYEVSGEGISTDPAKVDAVKLWPLPKTVKDVRAFIGFCSFYRKFIKDFAQIAAPLHKLMSGDSRRLILKEWDEVCQTAFDTLKSKLITAPVLKCPDFSREFILETDASFKGLGAVLSQKHDGKIHPICYASRGLRRSERNMTNYSSRKLELLALKWAVCNKFKDYLVGKEFTVYTDNNPLSHLETSKLGAIESQWVSELQQFDFKIMYKPGQDNTVADELSRLPEELDSDGEEEFTVMGTAEEVMGGELWSKEDLKEQQRGMECCKNITTFLTTKMTIDELKNMLKDEDFRKLHKVRQNLLVEDGVVWHKMSVGVNLWRIRPVLPPGLQYKLLQACHDDWGHQGRNRSLALVRSRGFWPGMSESVGEYIKRCERCCVAKDETPKPCTPMGKIEARKPWEMLAIDFTVLDKRQGIENVLIITDVFTRYSFAFPTKDQKAATIAKILKEYIFDKFGAPDKILSDQGRNFLSSLIKQLCNSYGVEKVRTTAYHPQGNGGCERFNRTLHGLLVTLDEREKKKWPEHVSALVSHYNMTPHATTGYSPFHLLFGREPKMPRDPVEVNETYETIDEWMAEWVEIQKTIWEVGKETETKQKSMTRKQREEKTKITDWGVGQEVLLRNNVKIGRCKMQDEWYSERWIIEEVLDAKNGLYKIKSGDDEQVRVENRCNLRAAPKLQPFGVKPKSQEDIPAAVASPRQLRNRIVGDNKG